MVIDSNHLRHVHFSKRYVLTNRTIQFESDKIKILSDTTFSFILTKTTNDRYNFEDSATYIDEIVNVSKKERFSRYRRVTRVSFNLKNGRKIILGDFDNEDFVEELLTSLKEQYQIQKDEMKIFVT